MPVKSKAQFRFMQAAKHGGLSTPGGPSKTVAEEFLSKGTTPYKALPNKVKKPKK